MATHKDSQQRKYMSDVRVSSSENINSNLGAEYVNTADWKQTMVHLSIFVLFSKM